ncbi:hypothetical protein C4901_15380 [Acidiferrobacter sp. SPIII_3]|jgi:uncharacterized protein YoaH (UPF0181 family)|uniref:hypothetical protein n=1 Tax=Acidiferrobacter sp. SPIII_3 TaxID=1281578 RepID=UPI000D737D76|nr:hypothetical protein [Acidiferrobacter sp. SPIII_3]AWP24537.1 hypothetical protein C4901_15380 [Acidiferrobacter sp. SPIII_3]
MKRRCEHYTPDLIANAEWLLDEAVQERRAQGITTQEAVARLADKIRALYSEGVGTAQIHRLLTDLGLRISYQDIREVVAAGDSVPTESGEDSP